MSVIPGLEDTGPNSDALSGFVVYRLVEGIEQVNSFFKCFNILRARLDKKSCSFHPGKEILTATVYAIGDQ